MDTELSHFLHDVWMKGSPEQIATLQGIFDRHGVDFVANPVGTAALVREIGRDGANTIASLFRGGGGVPYAEVVQDVAAAVKLAVPESRQRDVHWLEQQILFKVLADHFNGSEADLAALHEMLKAHHVDVAGRVATGAVTAAMWATLIRQVGAKVVAQIVRRVVATSAGWFAARQAASTAARVAGMAIPAVNIAMTAWLVADLASPAMRKTLPTVLDIAMLRMELVE